MLIWVITFSLTCLLELPIYVIPLRRVVPLGWALALVLGLNLATHPIVWFLLPRLFENQLHYVLIAEAFAVVVEGLILGALTFWRRWQGWGWLAMIGLAFLANAWSEALGELFGYRLLAWLGLVSR